jgi:FlaA1/EpsC-like NDP-sugar epimerase
MRGGEVFVTKMRALRVVDLAHAMADILSRGRIEMTTTGVRRGEKLYEELLADEELERTLDLERLLVVLPAPDGGPTDLDLWQVYRGAQVVEKAWNSSKETLMTKQEVVQYLREHGVLSEFMRPERTAE